MKTSNFKTFFENTIIDNIDFSGYGAEQQEIYSLKYKIDLLHETFKSEYCHQHNKHLNKVVLFKEWLQGLPSSCTVPFYNYDILQNGILAGFDLSTEEKEDIFLANYWLNLSKAFFTLKNNL